MHTAAIITAAGQGTRLKADVRKQYIQLRGRPVLYWTLKKFEESEIIDEIFLVVPRGDVVRCRDQLVDRYGFEKVVRVLSGGKRRQDSVARGFEAVRRSCDVVCIHDGVRPFVKPQTIVKAVRTAKNFGASCVAVRVKDTIKQISDDGFVLGTPNRRYLYAAQTPQAFHYDLYAQAVAYAKKNHLEATDDAALVEAMGGRVVIVDGSYENIKITTPGDLTLARQILEQEL